MYNEQHSSLGGKMKQTFYEIEQKKLLERYGVHSLESVYASLEKTFDGFSHILFNNENNFRTRLQMTDIQQASMDFILHQFPFTNSSLGHWSLLSHDSDIFRTPYQEEQLLFILNYRENLQNVNFIKQQFDKFKIQNFQHAHCVINRYGSIIKNPYHDLTLPNLFLLENPRIMDYLRNSSLQLRWNIQERRFHQIRFLSMNPSIYFYFVHDDSTFIEDVYGRNRYSLPKHAQITSLQTSRNFYHPNDKIVSYQYISFIPSLYKEEYFIYCGTYHRDNEQFDVYAQNSQISQSQFNQYKGDSS